MLRRLTIFVVGLLAFVSAPMTYGQDRWQSRSMGMSTSGIVATESVLASQVGARFSKETFEGCDVNFEVRIPETTRNELAAMGHKIVMRADFSSRRMGSGQAVQRDFGKGVNAGASDPRKDGAAVAELRGFKMAGKQAAGLYCEAVIATLPGESNVSGCAQSSPGLAAGYSGIGSADCAICYGTPGGRVFARTA